MELGSSFGQRGFSFFFSRTEARKHLEYNPGLRFGSALVLDKLWLVPRENVSTKHLAARYSKPLHLRMQCNWIIEILTKADRPKLSSFSELNLPSSLQFFIF